MYVFAGEHDASVSKCLLKREAGTLERAMRIDFSALLLFFKEIEFSWMTAAGVRGRGTHCSLKPVDPAPAREPGKWVL